MYGKSKKLALAVVLAIVILAISVIPALAGFDTGGGSTYIVREDLESRFPRGILLAEGWQ
jgi:hypothetical protein